MPDVAENRELKNAELAAALAMQRAACLAHPVPSLAERKRDLQTLQRFIREHKDALCEAISADYGNRSRHETLLAEIFPAIDGITHVLKHLKKWMRPQRRGVDWRTFPGTRNRVMPQPLGVVGIIVPWNFPVNLSLVPLTYIFAAGNRAMVKMSENSRHLARLLIDTMPAYFPPEKLQFFDETGGVGIDFSQLPFDHLLFTGSGQTGRAVMAAAAQNLCPVTLELGGKAPAIVCADFDVRTAAERILFVKYLNAGQICTSVDHAWLPEARIAAFVDHARQIMPARYAGLDTPDYTSIIDAAAFERLLQALDEARARGAQVISLLPGQAYDRATRKIAPHIVLDAPEDSLLLTREIFGPILPLRGYTNLESVIDSINAGPRPLAIYPFSNDARTVQLLIDRVMSGGVSVNDALYHVGQHDLPFGGVGESGMGHYHGVEGFHTFSKLRPVFYQARYSALKLLWPPYGKLASRVLAFLTR
ncbi:coniferyl aldehyde dehydrogenase [Janthinobacterium sp. HSC-3S05]|uniref:coniferyl aldehyde dehydrogenase n=1 Tax=Janthinobacterium lividum TaxID=29581 RepID=UPI001CD83804|nr:coniferyl aldehyde dehydrogenase [Janthinobacterium lividum]MCA1858798.1 coniferyl aldehyde dehydrogenase [Janthinobacterium lividum]